MSREIKRFRVQFSGRVQGVGFRYTAYHIAQGLGLTGWVQNEYDGTVLCEVQGERIDIDSFLGKISVNDRYIRVDGMKITEASPDPNERSFNIRG